MKPNRNFSVDDRGARENDFHSTMQFDIGRWQESAHRKLRRAKQKLRSQKSTSLDKLTAYKEIAFAFVKTLLTNAKENTQYIKQQLFNETRQDKS